MPPLWMLVIIFIVAIIGLIIYYFRWRKNSTDGGYQSSSYSSSSKESKEGRVIIVSDGAYKRKLKYLPNMGSTMDYNSKSPYQGMRYDTYIDDLGNYWRSYDDGKTFIKEDYKHEIV